MAANFDPKTRTIGEVLTSAQLTVPDWQRPFAWKAPNIEAFWNDIIGFSDLHPNANIADTQYFLGSVVFVTGQPLEVLDGQQRLATSIILLSVIRDFLKPADVKGALAIQTQFLASYHIATQNERDNLLLNAFDRDYFSQTIVRELAAPPEPRLPSHRDILAARRFFVATFEKQRDNLSAAAFAEWCRRVQMVLCEHCSVIQILTDDEDTAASIFETLNDRGLGLSTVDLLRNFLMRNAQEDDRDAITAAWDEILEDAVDFDISQFLRHFWISKHGDVKSQGLYKEIKGLLVRDHLDSLEFSLQIKEAAADYADLVKARSTVAELKRLFADINLIDATALYPALLSASSVFGDDDPAKTLALGRTMLIAFLRHNVVAGREASQFEAKAYEVARELRSNPDADYKAALRPLMPSDAEFEATFKNLAPRRIAWARFILAGIEEHKRHDEETLLAPSATLHVEHIYPKKPRFPKWPDHAQWVGRLGNLTLLGQRLNSQASNAPFDEKRPRYERSRIDMTRELANSPGDWSPDKITVRQNTLFDTAVALWPFE